jgi:hypothetical protein
MSFYHDKHLVKDLIDLKKQFNYGLFIETGTEKGDSVRTLVDYFDIIHTCEVDDKYYDYHTDLELNVKVHLHKGNSVDKLKEIFETLKDDKFFIYLDAHWGLYWPLLDELKVIKEYNFKPVIIIHDFETGIVGHIGDKYNVDGVTQTLNWDFIEDSIKSIYGDDSYDYHYNNETEINRGCVFIYPKL